MISFYYLFFLTYKFVIIIMVSFMEKQINEIFLNTCKQNNIKKHKIYLDYLKCKQKINFQEYLKMHFYELSASKRKEVLTSKENTKLINLLNPFEQRYLIISKGEFYHRFDKFIKRDWLLLDDKNSEEFRLFIKSRDHIFVPRAGNQDSTVLNLSNENEWQLNQELINTHHYIIEEVVKHHKIFDEITTKSLVTVKFITLLNNNSVYLLGSYLNIPKEKSKYYIPINLKTGKTINKAICNYLETDKIDDYQVKELEIPKWDEVIKLLKEIPLIVKNLRYISWEIAITNDDIILMSASDEPDCYILQHPIYLKNHQGLSRKINNILQGEIK